MALVSIDFIGIDAAAITAHPGRLVAFADETLDPEARRIDRLSRGALSRALKSQAWTEVKPGEGLDLAFPAGLEAAAVLLVRLPPRADAAAARKAGATIARGLTTQGALLAARSVRRLAPLVEGVALRAYDWSMRVEKPKVPGAVQVMCADPEAAKAACTPFVDRARAVHFARDLVNEPANVLTTSEFANRLETLRELGLEVEILDEPALEKLGMRALLAVGLGSETPAKVAVMQWKGAEGAPLALVGKGVVFDTGGISIKPAAGMEEMVMDMGGAAVVAGVMQALAQRKARARVVGLVGLVENMPDGRAQRPGDVVASMKGDTIEVINTDAEGRLVLADVMWYAQQRFNPCAMIDLATLTGAIIVSLGFEKAGVFANDDALCEALLAACATEGEGAWRMPLDPAYEPLIKSRVADVKNTGGRHGGAITAAQFLQCFVNKDLPWVHLDIAGVALPATEALLSPKGPTGWGVRALDTLIAQRFESRA